MSKKKKYCALFSGGKDSTMALYRAMQKKSCGVVVLLSMIPARDDSYMYHFPNIGLVKYQAEAIGIPIVTKKTSGVPPQENLDLKIALKEVKEKFGICGVITGTVSSRYQYNIISEICKDLSLEVFAPYWEKPHESLIEDALKEGFEIIITGVFAYGLDDSWLGKKLDYHALEELKKLNEKFGINIGGEGGEYETLVLDCPIFKKRLKILESEKIWNGVRGYLKITKVRLVEK